MLYNYDYIALFILGLKISYAYYKKNTAKTQNKF